MTAIKASLYLESLRECQCGIKHPVWPKLFIKLSEEPSLCWGPLFNNDKSNSSNNIKGDNKCVKTTAITTFIKNLLWPRYCIINFAWIISYTPNINDRVWYCYYLCITGRMLSNIYWLIRDRLGSHSSSVAFTLVLPFIIIHP